VAASTVTGMRVGLLGGLEVLDDDEQGVVVAGAKLRALVAVLALHVGRVVPAEQIVDALWGENPPAAVRNGLQGLASKLRRALGSAELVAMRGGGYALELPPEAVDVHRYEQLVAAGQAAAAAGDPSRAVALLGEADSLWRGDALEVLQRVPDGTLSFLYLLHPDPWPKARHAKRRMVNDRPVDLFAAKLKPGGEFRLATDDPTYLTWSLMVMQRHEHQFEWLAKTPKDFLEPSGGWIETRYGAKSRREGRRPYYLRYRRIG